MRKKVTDREIMDWISRNMNGCSCLIVFSGEKTHLSKWVKYEIQLANEKNLGRIIIDLVGVKNKNGIPCRYCYDPFAEHGLYTNNPTPYSYIVKRYRWIEHAGIKNIKNWIEDACIRAHR